MANDNKNTNELVSADDTTAELEALTAQHFGEEASQAELDADTCSFGADETEDTRSVNALRADLQLRDRTIERLRYDLEQLRSRWMGLDTEVRAREQQTRRLNADVTDLKRRLEKSERQVESRDQQLRDLSQELERERNERQQLAEANTKIAAELDGLRSRLGEPRIAELQAVIAEREDRIGELERDLESIANALQDDGHTPDHQRLAEQAGRLASYEARVRELGARNTRTEAYADELRRRVQHFEAASAAVEKARAILAHDLTEARHRIANLETEFAAAKETITRLHQQLKNQEQGHSEEIRMLRFELGEAQETVAQHETLNEELASELLESRGYRSELETMLTRTEELKQSVVEALEHENAALKADLATLQDKLERKDEAVNCLLAELAKKTQQLESIGQAEGSTGDIDEKKSERFDTRAAPEKDRLSRVLIGSVEGQELRFPLFKHRLTIGRTEQNDIQLNAAYISRRHAVIVTDGDRTRVIDWGSKNGVYVNATRVTEHFLKNGDVLAIGTAKFRYEERSKREA